MEHTIEDGFEPCSRPSRPILRDVARLWLRWRRAAQGRAELKLLDARTREDIGVSEADVARAVSRPWWRWPLV